MKEERKIDADKIHILAIKTLKGNIECLAEDDTNKISGHLFSFKLDTGLATESRLVGMKLLVDIKAIDKQEKELTITGSYTHEMIFKIGNLDDFILKEEGKEKLDAGLGSTLASIIYSTVRGIIYNRTQGTSIGVVILPVVAPLKLMELDIQRSKDNHEKGKKESKKRAKQTKK
jgi:hypothetical protein